MKNKVPKFKVGDVVARKSGWTRTILVITFDRNTGVPVYYYEYEGQGITTHGMCSEASLIRWSRMEHAR